MTDHTSLLPGAMQRLMAGLMLAIFLAALTQTIVGTALPTIGREFHDFEAIPWVVTAYLLAATCALPFYGKLADTYGRRPVLFAALGLFIVGSVLCALAPSMSVLILARVLQGIGGGGLIALPETVIGDIASPRDRAGYQVYIAAAFLAASLMGPIAGGFFVDHVSWRMIFWINVPLGLLAIVVANRSLAMVPHNEHPHRLDLPGAVLMMATVSTLILALSWAGKSFGWLSMETIGMLLLSVALAFAFLVWIRRTADPLIAFEVLSDNVVRVSLAAAALGVGLTVGLAIYAPIFLERGRGLSASEAGVMLVPFMVGSTIGALLAGQAMKHYSHYKRLPLVAMPVAAVAAAILVWGTSSLPIWAIAVTLAIVSTALGTLVPIATVAIQNAVALHDLGTATATSNIFRQLGSSVAVAVFGTLVFGHHPGESALGPFEAMFAVVTVGAILSFLVVLRLEERSMGD